MFKKESIFVDETPEYNLWDIPKRSEIDMRTFKLIKLEMRDKNRTNVSIAHDYGISLTSLYLIKRSKSYKQYKQTRRQHSKPHKYGVENNGKRTKSNRSASNKPGI